MKSLSDISKLLAKKTKKTLWILGLHAFSIILLFIIIDLILGGFIFYKYVFLAEKEVPTITGNILKFDEKTYQNVLGELQAREQAGGGAPTTNQSVPSE